MAIDHDKLLAAIDEKSGDAYGAEASSDIAAHQASLIEAYLGLNTNPAPPGRSQVVDRSVYETIQTMLPSLVRIFAGSSDQVVKFMPVGPEDEAAAEQTTAYINYVTCQLNPWEQFCADWIFDALLLPNGYAMAYWDESGTVERETYEGLTSEQLAVLMQDGTEVIQHSERPDEEQDKINQQQYAQMMQQYQMAAAMAMQQGQMPPPPPQPPPPAVLHDVVVERENKGGKVRLCVLPPEHCLVDDDCPDWTLNECNYFEYRQTKTIADLRAMGLEVDEDISDSLDADDQPADFARNRFGESNTLGEGEGSGVMREVTARTIWIRCAAEEDDEPELYYCVAVGRTILHAEPVSRIHAVSMVAQPLPHRHPGMSVAESVLDLQEIQTAVTRGGLDNLYLANNGRYVLSDKVNLDDFLDSRPGGGVRLRDGAMPGDGHVQQLTHPFAFNQIVQAKEYFDQMRQNRAGVSRYFSGTDAGAINRTASGTMALQNMAAQRIEHIARMMAPAFENLFSIVHELVSKHQNKADVIKLRGEWINVDPTSWHTRRDVKISVGVGAGNKDTMLAWLTQQIQMQMALAPTGIVKPENLYASVIEQAKLQGHANPEKFWTKPTGQPQPQQPPPEIVKTQMQLQYDGQKTQAQMRADMQKALFDAQQAEKQRAQDAAIEKYRIDKQAETALQTAQIQAGKDIQVEAAKLQTTVDVKTADIQNQRDLELFRAQNEATRAAADEAKGRMEQDMMGQHMGEMKQGLQELAKELKGKKAVSVSKKRDAEGRMVAAIIKRGDGTVDEVPIK